jgi:hypothetical protein
MLLTGVERPLLLNPNGSWGCLYTPRGFPPIPLLSFVAHEHNAGYIPNYGERWRYGERISTAFAESAVNQVVSKRMVKCQQMRWSPRSAHLLLQVRTRVLNEELRRTFGHWFGGFDAGAREQDAPQTT